MINCAYKTVGNILSPAGKNARLTILMYHRILPAADKFFPEEETDESFDLSLAALKQVFNVLSMDEAITRLNSGTLPARAACITFDDGYKDNATIALPILQKHGLKAIFFIATAYLNGGRMFNDTVVHAVKHYREAQLDLSALDLGVHDTHTPEAKAWATNLILRKVKYLPMGLREETAAEIARLATDVPPPNDLMMDSRHLKQLLEAGMEIGGHTARHPILAKLDNAAANREIAEGKDFLEDLLSIKLKFFAYPNGYPGVDYTAEQADIPRKLGFQAAVSAHTGYAHRGSDLFQLPRITPHTGKLWRFHPDLFRNLLSQSNP